MKVSWDIINKCNLKCKHCAVAHNLSDSFFLSDNSIRNIIQNISGVVTEVDLLGGEPLLAPHFLLIQEELIKFNISYNVITNGQFNSSYLQHLFQNTKNLQNISISLEGLKIQNDQIRRNGSFDKAISTYYFFKELQNTSNASFKVGINMTINNLNCNNIQSTLHYFLNILKVDYLQLSPIRNEGNVYNNNDLLPCASDIFFAYQQIATFTKNYPYPEKIILDYVNPLLSEYLNANYQIDLPIESAGCPAIESSMYVNSEGILSPCRECNTCSIDLKKHNLNENFNLLAPFFNNKISYCYTTNCDCIYKDICNHCMYNSNLLKPELCNIIENNYDIEKMCANIRFKIGTSYCLYSDPIHESYGIFYPTLGERVEYENIGYIILNEILSTPHTANEISNNVKIDSNLIFRFLVQEQSKQHVIQM